MELKPNAVDVNAAATPNGSAGSGSSSKSSSRLSELVLVFSGVGAADGEFYIQANLSIGRNASNTVVLEQDSIERIHTVVRRGGQGGLLLAAVEGAAPPRVGGVNQPTIALCSGVEFTLGAATFRVVHAQPAAAATGAQAMVGRVCLQCGRAIDAATGARDYKCSGCGLRHGWCDQPSQGVRAWLPLALGPYRVRRYVARGTTTTEMRKMRRNDHWKNAYQARLTTIFLISNGKTSISIPCH